MDIKKNTLTKQNNNKYYNTEIVNEPNQIKPLKNYAKRNTNINIETKNYNDFMGVFGVHPNDAKYLKKKKKQKKKDCKTPDKNNSEKNKTKDNKRNCKTPFKLKDFLFNNKEPIIQEKNNNYNTINNIEVVKKTKKQQNESKNNGIDDWVIKDNKSIEKDIKAEKNQTEKVNKKPMLKRATKIYELNFYDPFTENVNILDGEGNSYDVEFKRKDLEIKITFKENIFNSFNDIHFTLDYFSFPQYCIHKVKFNSDTKITTIVLKDYRSFKIQTKDDDFYKKVKFEPKERIDFFKYAYLFSASKSHQKIKYPVNGWEIYNPMKEFDRQKVPYGMDSFRLSQINIKYKLCETYPSLLIVPSHYDDASLTRIASCRIKNRFPALTYVYTYPNNDNNDSNENSNNNNSSKNSNEISNENSSKNFNENSEKNSNDNKIQTFLFRSAQINTGSMFNKKFNYEIDYINAITSIGKCKNGFIFYDCRPYLNAKANTLKGAGVDDISQYNNCKELIFGCIENIHAVRKSLKKAFEKANFGNSSINNAKLSFNTSNNNVKKFLSRLEESKWLEYLSDILCGTNVVISKLLSQIHVICHCSDGWDRTSQICSLVQLILDPYFRTFEGFAVLIEKDWVSFGHQFAIRNGCDCRPEKMKEKSPIFIQFLHAVYQIMVQYPNAFEFRENMLMFLCDEIYSNKFGTFLFNSEKELNENEAKLITVSIWSEIFLNKKKFLNPFFKWIKEPLIIKGEVQYLTLWKEFFYKYIKIGLVREEDGGLVEINKFSHMENMLFKQKESVIELMNIIKKYGLENEMKNNEFYKIYKDYLG